MLQFPQLSPIAIELGSIRIHWYAIMYLIGFAAAWLLGRQRARRTDWSWPEARINDLVLLTALGIILGGHAGYVLFYNFPVFLSNPLKIFHIWESGMSFHGGLLGVMLALWFFVRRHQVNYFATLDFIAPLVPIGLGAGRLGNFINGELWGRTSNVPWAMVFPGAGALPRHPSQLYQFLLEGVVLFILLWGYSARPRPTLAVAGMFALLYGLFRFLVEFVRQPDAHLGLVALGWMSMGQVLSLPLLLVGLFMLGHAYRRI